jgi:hypothetical protein
VNINFRHLIPLDFIENSHLWTYQSNRAFTTHEALQIKEFLQNFTKEWRSHGIPLKCYANLFSVQVIVFMCDEVARGVSGSSTDRSITLIKKIEKSFHVELFDRLMLAPIIQERIQLIPISQINSYLENGLITINTLYFNNTILTKKNCCITGSFLLKKVGSL